MREIIVVIFCALCEKILLPADCNMELFRLGYPVHTDCYEKVRQQSFEEQRNADRLN